MAEPIQAVQSTEKMQEQLEQRLFHLKTLYDVSRQLLGEVNVDKILKDFLLMTTGNFGVIEGFLLIRSQKTREIKHFASVGFQEDLRRMIAMGAEASPPDSGLPSSVVCKLPFAVDDDYSGILGLGAKIVDHSYSDEDKDLLLTLVNNLVVTLKNARYAEALEKAYEEVSSLSRAKSKMIDHLSHEMKTPLSVLAAALVLLEKRLRDIPEEKWKRPFERAQRSVSRLMEIQYEAEDIVEGKMFKAYGLLDKMLNTCADELEMLVSEKTGEGPIVEWLRDQIEETFGPRDLTAEEIVLGPFVGERLKKMRPSFSHRDVSVSLQADPVVSVTMPRDPLEKVVDGLIRNAVENTPDGGEISVAVEAANEGVRLEVKDTGVGIVQEHQRHIFEGFFPTQETSAYSSKHPFDFEAGGKGADLLRMKIFSERHQFSLSMDSIRCRFLPRASNRCPGRIQACGHCKTPGDCVDSGGTCFKVVFPGLTEEEAPAFGPAGVKMN